MSKSNTNSLMRIPENTPAAFQKDAEAGMWSPTKAISDRWAKSMAQANSLSLTDLYQRCQDIKTVLENKDFYGETAADQLRDRHGLSKDSIRDYERVATYISKQDFARITQYNEAAPANSKTPFTTTHLIRLSRIGDKEIRNELMLKTFTECWTSDRLSEEATKLISNDPTLGVTGKTQELRPTAVTNKVHAAADKLLSALMPIDTDEFLGRLTAVKSKDIQKSLDNIASAIESLSLIEEEVHGRIVTLQSAQQELSRQKDIADTKDAGSSPEDARMSAEFDKVQKQKIENKKAATKTVEGKVVAKSSLPPKKPNTPSTAAIDAGDDSPADVATSKTVKTATKTAVKPTTDPVKKKKKFKKKTPTTSVLVGGIATND